MTETSEFDLPQPGQRENEYFALLRKHSELMYEALSNFLQYEKDRCLPKAGLPVRAKRFWQYIVQHYPILRRDGAADLCEFYLEAHRHMHASYPESETPILGPSERAALALVACRRLKKLGKLNDSEGKPLSERGQVFVLQHYIEHQYGYLMSNCSESEAKTALLDDDNCSNSVRPAAWGALTGLIAFLMLSSVGWRLPDRTERDNRKHNNGVRFQQVPPPPQDYRPIHIIPPENKVPLTDEQEKQQRFREELMRWQQEQSLDSDILLRLRKGGTDRER